MKKIFRKEYFLVFVSVVVIFYAVILNIFYPQVKETKKYGEKKAENGIKTDFRNSLNKFVSDDVAGLSFGYLLGEKSELPPGVESKMKAIGLAHIIVVSGTHLSIIISASRKIFEKVSRFSALYFSIFLLVLYVSLIGWSPSTIRASFVAIFSIVAWFLGREHRVLRTVLFTLAFCLLINPYFLTNISFQLSMLAYSGVVIIMPKMVHYFYGRDKPGFLGSTILSSLSAIIACLPIQLYYFGSMNLIAILANLLILPTIPFAMGLSFMTGFLGMIHLDFLAVGFGQMTEFVLSYHVKVITYLENKAEFLFEFQKNNPIFLGLYVVIIFGLIFVSIHKNIKVGKGNAKYHDNSLVSVNEAKDVVGEAVEREEIGDTPRTERDKQCRENNSFNDAKNAKNTTSARAKIEQHWKT